MNGKVAICQFPIKWEEKENNMKMAASWVQEAVEEKSELVLFPEMSFTGFSMNVEKVKDRCLETITQMKEIAIEHQIAVGFGWIKESSEKVENHYTVIDFNGTILTDYTKIHSFRYGGEDKQFQSGNRIQYFQLGNFTYSIFICYDLRFPEIFQIASKKAEVLLVPANWPLTRREHWKCLLQARAIENQAYVLGINCVGNCGEQEYSGDSCMIRPDGKVEQMISDKEGIVYAQLEKDELIVRESFPLKLDRKEALYRQLIEESAGD